MQNSNNLAKQGVLCNGQRLSAFDPTNPCFIVSTEPRVTARKDATKGRRRRASNPRLLAEKAPAVKLSQTERNERIYNRSW